MSASMYERMTVVSRQLEWTGVQHRANYVPMLDRMAAGRPAEPLRVLADAVEAQGLGPRARAAQVHQPRPVESPGGCGATGKRNGPRQWNLPRGG